MPEPTFIHLVSQDRIFNLSSIVQFDYMPGDEEDDDNVLTISTTDGSDVEIEGKEAEVIYLELLKKLPHLIVIKGK